MTFFVRVLKRYWQWLRKKQHRTCFLHSRTKTTAMSQFLLFWWKSKHNNHFILHIRQNTYSQETIALIMYTYWGLDKTGKDLNTYMFFTWIVLFRKFVKSFQWFKFFLVRNWESFSTWLIDVICLGKGSVRRGSGKLGKRRGMMGERGSIFCGESLDKLQTLENIVLKGFKVEKKSMSMSKMYGSSNWERISLMNSSVSHWCFVLPLHDGWHEVHTGMVLTTTVSSLQFSNSSRGTNNPSSQKYFSQQDTLERDIQTINCSS